MHINHIKYSLIAIGLYITFASCAVNNDNKLLIATSANMQFAIQEIVDAFKIDTGIECDLIISSSGILTAQIKEGAPFDIFISADMKYPIELFNSGFSKMPPKVYAYGRLVLWSLSDTLAPTLDILISNSVKHIAVANPKTAPYGKAALEVLEKMNILPSVEDKLVYGEGISQTNQFIISQSSEMGFTAKSVVLSDKIAASGNWLEISDTLHSPIEQGALILNRSIAKDGKAEKFYNFLFSDKSKDILSKFGYITVQLQE